MAPESILGITFTNKAADELADRLRTGLPEMAHDGREVDVTTYHGFAWKLLQEFGALVGVERDAKVIGGGYTRQLLEESLRGARYVALDMSSPPHRVAEAAMLARQLGENLLGVDDLLASVPPSADPVWEKRIELAGIIARFQAAKRSLGVVDYADLVEAAHRLVTGFEEIRARVRSRYSLVLLDEYQDTDPGQRELMRELFGDGFPVTAVGDSDQTIYEWRGASLENFKAFPEHFRRSDGRPAETLPLSLNRRSGRIILELANRVRGQADPMAGFNVLHPVETAGDGDLVLSYHATSVDEAASIAEEIRRIHDEEGVAWREIALLFRKNRHMGLVREALEGHSIPHEVASLGGLLDVPRVADLHAWLRVLGRPDDSAALARILLGGRYRLGLGDLVPLAGWVGAMGRGSTAEEGLGWPLLEAVDRLDDVEGLAGEARERLEEFRDTFRKLLTDAQSVALVELCRRILDVTDTWAEVEALDPAGALTGRLNLYRFLDLAEEWSPLEGRPSLDAFLGYLGLLTEERATDELDTARIGQEDAVSLITVHRAKGLEWDTVFIPAVSREAFPAKSLGFDNPVERAQYLPFGLRLDAEALPRLDRSNKENQEELRVRHVAQEWRTAYVAVTRAKARLYVSGAWWYTPGQPREPSELHATTRRTKGVTLSVDVDDQGGPPDLLRFPTPEGAPDPVFPGGWQAALRAIADDPEWTARHVAQGRQAYDAHMEQIELLLDGLPEPPTIERGPALLSVSVTGLVTLASCPQRFLWSEVERLPRRPDASRTRGVEVHRRIELHNRGQLPLDELDDDLYDLSPAEGDAGSGGDPYGAFLGSRFADARPRFTEVPIDLRLPSGRVRGRIDAVYEPEPGVWEIVDFKSGRHRDDPARDVQLEAYAVAAAEGAVSSEPPVDLTVSFVYLGSGEAVEVSRRVDDAWMEDARARLEGLMTAAGGEAFAPRPGPACGGCDFLHLCPAGRAHVAAATSP
jgi:DNA helicase-2/ATP-dependent DNA helicase PcrA